MPSYKVNRRAVAHARKLIDAHHYVIRSDWRVAQPSAGEGNAFLEHHSWEEYGAWHLAVTEGTAEETKRHYGFVYGDFRRVHRMGLIACQYRAAEWEHKEIERAATKLLAHLDETRKKKPAAKKAAAKKPAKKKAAKRRPVKRSSAKRKKVARKRQQR